MNHNNKLCINHSHSNVLCNNICKCKCHRIIPVLRIETFPKDAIDIYNNLAYYGGLNWLNMNKNHYFILSFLIQKFFFP